MNRPLLKKIAGAVLVSALALAILRAIPEPSTHRDWIPAQARQATAEPAKGGLLIHDVRNFRYAADGEPRLQRWEDRLYDPAQIESAWFGLSPIGTVPGVAHVFVSFGFADGRYLAVSVEARRERDEAYSPLLGLLRAYEMTYVIGDERDVIALRTNVGHADVFLYPVRASRDAIRAMFEDMLARATGLATTPEFYDTLTNSCSSNLARHVNDVAPGTIRGSLRVVFAGFSDSLARELGLIDFDGPIADARARFRVNERAAGDVDAGDFSARIRDGVGVD